MSQTSTPGTPPGPSSGAPAGAPRGPAEGAAAAGAPTAGAPGPGAPGPGAGVPLRKRGMGTSTDMLRSLAVIVALVAVVVLIIPRPQGRLSEPVDVAGVTQQAVERGFPVGVPDVPAGWIETEATLEPDRSQGITTWQVSYQVPGGTWARVDVTTGSTPAWVSSSTRDGEEDGEREVAGESWVTSTSQENDRQRSLVLTEGTTTTVVTGTADDTDLDTLADAVRAAA